MKITDGRMQEKLFFLGAVVQAVKYIKARFFAIMLYVILDSSWQRFSVICFTSARCLI
jgi:hypothetical protein